MQITFPVTEYQTVNLTLKQQKDVTVDTLNMLWSPGEFLQVIDGTTFLMKDDEYRHGSVSSSRVREATLLDKAISLVMKNVHNLT